MKFSIARSELLDALNVAGKALSSRSTLPILSGILASTAEGSLILQATDLEVSVKHTVPALVEKEGQSVLPGKLVSDIVRSMPEAAVTIETENDIAHITCGSSSFTVKTLSGFDYPRFPEVSVDKKIVMPGKVLAGMVRMVSKAVSRDETRAILTGILVVVEGPTVKMVATDSYRLAVKETVLETPAGEDAEVVVPGKALEEVARLAADSPTVSIGIAENQVLFEFGDSVFVTRRIEGTFPNYKQLIPKECGTKVTLMADELSSAVKRVALMAQHNSPLKVAVNVEDMTLSLSATTQDIGDASEDLMVKAQGQDVEIAFNHAFLMDGIGSADSEQLDLEVQDALKPGLLKTGGDDSFLYLLMPVRLG
jgi:DNA polymerase-3 subunit beta